MLVFSPLSMRKGNVHMKLGTVEMKSLRLVLFFAAVFCLCTAPSYAQGTVVPKAQEEILVQNFYDALLSTMKEGEQLGFQGRYDKLAPVIVKTFNMPLMTRYAVGPTWNKTAPQKQQALIDSFTKFSIATYASRFKKFTGEKFEVDGIKTTTNKLQMVQTKLTPKDEAPVELNYLIRKDKNGTPRIADVYLGAGISELATRRAEFTAVIKRDGTDKLIASLKEKAEDMGKK